MSTQTQPNRKLVIAAAVVIVISAAAWGSTTLLGHGDSESTSDAYVQADFTLVAPRVGGQIASVLVHDNENVKAGQLLATIDDLDYRAALASAQADVIAAKAAVANFDVQIARQPALVNQAQATLQSDQAAVTYAADNAARYRDLSAAGAGSAQEQQQTTSALAQQIAQRTRDRAGLVATQGNLDVLRTERDKADGTLARAEAALQQAQLNLSYTEIHAPIDGKIGRRSARVGAIVAPGAPLLAVVPLADAYVVANYQENEIAKMRAGNPVRIKVDSLPGVVIRGHVDSLAPATGLSFAPIAPDNATGNFTKIVQRVPVKIDIDPNQSAASALSVGLSVETEIALDSRGDATNAGGSGQ